MRAALASAAACVCASAALRMPLHPACKCTSPCHAVGATPGLLGSRPARHVRLSPSLRCGRFAFCRWSLASWTYDLQNRVDQAAQRRHAGMRQLLRLPLTGQAAPPCPHRSPPCTPQMELDKNGDAARVVPLYSFDFKALNLSTTCAPAAGAFPCTTPEGEQVAGEGGEQSRLPGPLPGRPAAAAPPLNGGSHPS